MAELDLGRVVGAGVPAGGTDGDVLVKNGATDYAARWTNTPPQMGSLAYIETTSSVSKQDGYQQGDYLVYNGQLYKVTASTITQGQTLNPGQGGNITAVNVGGVLSAVAPETISFSYQTLGSVFARNSATQRLVQIPIPVGYNNISTNIVAGTVVFAREFGKLDQISFMVTGVDYFINGPFARIIITGTGLENYNDVLSGGNNINITLTK